MDALPCQLPPPLRPDGLHAVADGWVAFGGDPARGGLAWMVCPAPALAQRLRAARYLRSVVLLRASDGALWCATFHEPVTRAHVEWLDHQLCAVPEPRTPDHVRAHGVVWRGGPMALEVPSFARIDESNWHPLSLAHAVAGARGVSAAGAGGAARLNTRVAQLAELIRAEIAAGLDRFRAAVDVDAMALAAPAAEPGAAQGVLYNYLVRAPWSAQRRQFAATLPVLASAAAGVAGSSLSAGLRDAVDARAPLLRAVARQAGVRTAALRALTDAQAAALPAAVRRDLSNLLHTLDALVATGTVPRGKAAWARVGALALAARRRFARGPAQSALVRAWLRERWRNGGDTSDERPDATARAEAADFDDLCQGLSDYLCANVATDPVLHDPAVAVARVRQVVQRQFDRMSYAELIGAVRALAALRDAATPADPPAPPAITLLPEPVRLTRVPRVARCLDTSLALKAHGVALHNCLARASLGAYTKAVTRDELHVVGLFDAATGAPCSTLEIALLVDELGTVRAFVNQHTGLANQTVSDTCQRARWELEFVLADPAMQRRLQAIVERRGQIARHLSELQAARRVGRDPAHVRLALGPRRVGQLLARCRAAG